MEIALDLDGVFMRTESLGFSNLENLGIRREQRFTISAYSRVEIHAKGASRSWTVSLVHKFNEE